MRNKPTADFDAKTFLTKAGTGRSVSVYLKKQVVFTQGDRADSVFYLERGQIKLAVISEHGKAAIVAMLGRGDFFGEGCLAGQSVRMASASAITDVTVVRIERETMIRLLHEPSSFSERFMAHLLARNVRIEEDLVDQLFNSSEKRLARVLLLLARFGKEGKTEPMIPKISQEVLAEMVGTTRPRISGFMNKFRKLGFIEYNGGLHIHSSLLNVLLHDKTSAGRHGDASTNGRRRRSS
jgi:CRP-like cAMP-binding protein